MASRGGDGQVTRREAQWVISSFLGDDPKTLETAQPVVDKVLGRSKDPLTLRSALSALLITARGLYERNRHEELAELLKKPVACVAKVLQMKKVKDWSPQDVELVLPWTAAVSMLALSYDVMGLETQKDKLMDAVARAVKAAPADAIVACARELLDYGLVPRTLIKHKDVDALCKVKAEAISTLTILEEEQMRQLEASPSSPRPSNKASPSLTRRAGMTASAASSAAKSGSPSLARRVASNAVSAASSSGRQTAAGAPSSSAASSRHASAMRGPPTRDKMLQSVRQGVRVVMGVPGIVNENDMATATWSERDAQRRQFGLEVLAELGRCALALGDKELASKCASHCTSASAADAAAVHGRLLHASIVLAGLTKPFTERALTLRVKCIGEALLALSSAKQIGLTGLIQSVCLGIWDMAQPLLQPKLRHTVKRALTVCSQALLSIQSPLLLIRCAIHIELAKILEDADLCQAALGEIERAEELCRGDDEFDDILKEMRGRLEVKVAPEPLDESAGPYKLVVQFVEQARRAADKAAARFLLVKAARLVFPNALTRKVLDELGPQATAALSLGDKQRHEQLISLRETEAPLNDMLSTADAVTLLVLLATTAQQLALWDVAIACAQMGIKLCAWEAPKDLPVFTTGENIKALSQRPNAASRSEYGDTDHELQEMSTLFCMQAEAAIHLLRSHGGQLVIEEFEFPEPAPEEESALSTQRGAGSGRKGKSGKASKAPPPAKSQRGSAHKRSGKGKKGKAHAVDTSGGSGGGENEGGGDGDNGEQGVAQEGEELEGEDSQQQESDAGETQDDSRGSADGSGGAEAVKFLADIEDFDAPPATDADEEAALKRAMAESDPALKHASVLEFEEWQQGLTTFALTSLVKALLAAQNARKPWLMNNCAVYLWNYLTPALNARPSGSTVHARILNLVDTTLAIVNSVRLTEGSVAFNTMRMEYHHLLARLLADVITHPNALEPLQEELKPRLTRVTEHTLDMTCKLAQFKANRFCYGYADKIVQLAVLVARHTNTQPSLEAKDGHVRCLAAVRSLERMPAEEVTEKLVDKAMAQMQSATASARHPATFPKPLRASLWCSIARVCDSSGMRVRAKKACSYVLAIINSMGTKTKAQKKKDQVQAQSLLAQAHIVLAHVEAEETANKFSLSSSDDSTVHGSAHRAALCGVLAHAVEATSLATKSGLVPCVAEALQTLWDSCVVFVNDDQGRGVMVQQLSSALQTVSRLQPAALASLDAAVGRLRASLYEVAIKAHADAHSWQDALAAADAGMRHLPQRLQDDIMVHRLVCKVKLGQDIERDMYKLSKQPQTAQAGVWRAFALIERDPQQKIKAYKRAVECYESAGTHRLSLGDTLLELASCLHTSGTPPADVMRLLDRASGAVRDLLDPYAAQNTEAVTKAAAEDTAKASKGTKGAKGGGDGSGADAGATDPPAVHALQQCLLANDVVLRVELMRYLNQNTTQRAAVISFGRLWRAVHTFWQALVLLGDTALDPQQQQQRQQQQKAGSKGKKGTAAATGPAVVLSSHATAKEQLPPPEDVQGWLDFDVGSFVLRGRLPEVLLRYAGQATCHLALAAIERAMETGIAYAALPLCKLVPVLCLQSSLEAAGHEVAGSGDADAMGPAHGTGAHGGGGGGGTDGTSGSNTGGAVSNPTSGAKKPGSSAATAAAAAAGGSGSSGDGGGGTSSLTPAQTLASVAPAHSTEHPQCMLAQVLTLRIVLEAGLPGAAVLRESITQHFTRNLPACWLSMAWHQNHLRPTHVEPVLVRYVWLASARHLAAMFELAPLGSLLPQLTALFAASAADTGADLQLRALTALVDVLSGRALTTPPVPVRTRGGGGGDGDCGSAEVDPASLPAVLEMYRLALCALEGNTRNAPGASTRRVTGNRRAVVAMRGFATACLATMEQGPLRSSLAYTHVRTRYLASLLTCECSMAIGDRPLVRDMLGSVNKLATTIEFQWPSMCRRLLLLQSRMLWDLVDHHNIPRFCTGWTKNPAFVVGAQTVLEALSTLERVDAKGDACHEAAEALMDDLNLTPLTDVFERVRTIVDCDTGISALRVRADLHAAQCKMQLRSSGVSSASMVGGPEKTRSTGTTSTPIMAQADTSHNNNNNNAAAATVTGHSVAEAITQDEGDGDDDDNDVVTRYLNSEEEDWPEELLQFRDALTVCSDTFMVEASDFTSRIEESSPEVQRHVRKLRAEMAARTAVALALSAQTALPINRNTKPRAGPFLGKEGEEEEQEGEAKKTREMETGNDAGQGVEEAEEPPAAGKGVDDGTVQKRKEREHIPPPKTKQKPQQKEELSADSHAHTDAGAGENGDETHTNAEETEEDPPMERDGVSDGASMATESQRGGHDAIEETEQEDKTQEQADGADENGPQELVDDLAEQALAAVQQTLELSPDETWAYTMLQDACAAGALSSASPALRCKFVIFHQALGACMELLHTLGRSHTTSPAPTLTASLLRQLCACTHLHAPLLWTMRVQPLSQQLCRTVRGLPAAIVSPSCLDQLSRLSTDVIALTMHNGIGTCAVLPKASTAEPYVLDLGRVGPLLLHAASRMRAFSAAFAAAQAASPAREVLEFVAASLWTENKKEEEEQKEKEQGQSGSSAGARGGGDAGDGNKKREKGAHATESSSGDGGADEMKQKGKGGKDAQGQEEDEQQESTEPSRRQKLIARYGQALVDSVQEAIGAYRAMLTTTRTLWQPVLSCLSEFQGKAASSQALLFCAQAGAHVAFPLQHLHPTQNISRDLAVTIFIGRHRVLDQESGTPCDAREVTASAASTGALFSTAHLSAQAFADFKALVNRVSKDVASKASWPVVPISAPPEAPGCLHALVDCECMIRAGTLCRIPLPLMLHKESPAPRLLLNFDQDMCDVHFAERLHHVTLSGVGCVLTHAQATSRALRDKSMESVLTALKESTSGVIAARVDPVFESVEDPDAVTTTSTKGKKDSGRKTAKTPKGKATPATKDDTGENKDVLHPPPFITKQLVCFGAQRAKFA